MHLQKSETRMFGETKEKKNAGFWPFKTCPLKREAHQAVPSKICYSSDMTAGNPVSLITTQCSR